MTRHSGESRNPGLKHDFKGWFTTWIPAFAGMTIVFYLEGGNDGFIQGT